tara:strand:+ start:163 stop:351 length:189 start_codon:yes stop_codon:yes gene_type:complete
MRIQDIQFCLENLKDISKNISSSELATPIEGKNYNTIESYMTVGDCLDNVIEKLQQEECKKL